MSEGKAWALSWGDVPVGDVPVGDVPVGDVPVGDVPTKVTRPAFGPDPNLDSVLRSSIDGQTWDAAFAAVERPTFEQSWAYGEAAAASGLGTPRRGIFTDDSVPMGIVQAIVRPVGRLFTLVQVTRGPQWCGRAPAPAPGESAQAAAYAALRDSFRLTDRRVLIWLPAERSSAAATARLARVGKRAIVTGYSTVWLDLAQDEDALRRDLAGKWRNLLRKAETSRLRVEASHDGPPLVWLLERYAAQRRQRRFGGPSAAMLAALPAVAPRRSDVLLLRAHGGREVLSGALFLRHGRSATYLAGWSGPEGRRCAAQNLLLWQGALRLKEAGTVWFDLGGVDGIRAPGIARFKLGTGGEVETLAGTFV